MQEKSQRSLFSMTWPIFFELILQMMVGNVDQFMISRYSQNSVAAIGNANQILNVLLLAFSVISLATTILVSQYRGAKDTRRVGQIYSLALLTNFIFSLVITMILLCFNRQIFTWMKVPAEVLQESSTYITIIGNFIFLQAIALTFSAIFRSNAWLKEALSISVVVNMLNIIGNAMLIRGFGSVKPMGLAGVAISSNFARAVGIVIYILIFLRRSDIPIKFKNLKPFPWKQEMKLLSIGLPAAGESLSYSSAQMCILRFVNTFGTQVITTSIYSKMFAILSYIYTSAVAQASQIMVGYMMGARQIDEVNRRVVSTVKIAMVISLTMSTLLFLSSDLLFGFFTPSQEVLRLGKLILLIDIPLELGRAVNMVIIRSLQAAGDIRFPVISGILCVWGVEVTLSYFLGVHLQLGLAGVWMAMAFDEVFRASIYIWRWRKGHWRRMQLITSSVYEEID